MTSIEEGYINRLKNKLFGLLCEFENKGQWESFLDSITTELLDVPEEEWTINYLTLMHKIHSLRYLNYKYFRKTIFDCMNLLGSSDLANLLNSEVQ